MAADTRVVQVPESLYLRLERLATLTRRPVEAVIEQALSSSIPPLPDDLSPEWRDVLMRLEALSDAELWEVTRATFPDDQYVRLSELREQRRDGTLAPDDAAALDELLRAADLLASRRAYAAVLLKWRGHRLPSLAELNA